MTDDFPSRPLGDEPPRVPERRHGYYYAEGGRVLWKDERGTRVVTSALSTSARDLEAFERAMQVARTQREYAGQVSAKHWEMMRMAHPGLTVDP